ncbi:MAG: GNAT family N-acetyltransferase, partial [Bacteroidales bacterium]
MKMGVFECIRIHNGIRQQVYRDEVTRNAIEGKYCYTIFLIFSWTAWMKRLLHTAAHIVFLIRNFWYAKNIRRMQLVHYKGFAIGPLLHRHVDAALTLYKKLNNEKNLGTAKTLLLKIFGARLCLAAYNKDNQIIGISVYYFNARDKKENSIHEGYTGVDPRFQNKGLGTELRRLAASHF